MAMLRVLIADEYPLLRDAIKDVTGQTFLSLGWDFTISKATTADDVIAAAERDDELDCSAAAMTSLEDAHPAELDAQPARAASAAA